MCTVIVVKRVNKRFKFFFVASNCNIDVCSVWKMKVAGDQLSDSWLWSLDYTTILYSHLIGHMQTAVSTWPVHKLPRIWRKVAQKFATLFPKVVHFHKVAKKLPDFEKADKNLSTKRLAMKPVEASKSIWYVSQQQFFLSIMHRDFWPYVFSW